MYYRSIPGFDFHDFSVAGIEDQNKNLLFAGGSTELITLNTAAALLKLDSDGNLIWYKLYQDSGFSNCAALSVTQTLDSGYIVTGQIDLTSIQSSFISKADSLGNIQWSILASQGVRIKQIVESSGSTYYCTGTSNNNSISRGLDVFVCRLDGTGSSIWVKNFGDTLDDEGTSVAPTSDNGCVIVGRTKNFNALNYDIYIVKIDSSGNKIWSKRWQSPGSDGSSFGQGPVIRELANKNLVVGASTNGVGFGDSDALLLMLDSNGNNIWSKIYGTGGSETLASLCEIPNGDLIVSGNTIQNGTDFSAFAMRIDSNGSQIWSMIYGLNAGTRFFTSIASMSSLISCGIVNGSTFPPLGSANTYLTKARIQNGISGCYESQITFFDSSTTINCIPVHLYKHVSAWTR